MEANINEPMCVYIYIWSYMMNYLYTCMSGGSTNGVTPILVGFYLINHPAIGVPPLMETPMYKWPALATTNPLRYLRVIFHGDRPWSHNLRRSQPRPKRSPRRPSWKRPRCALRSGPLAWLQRRRTDIAWYGTEYDMGAIGLFTN